MKKKQLNFFFKLFVLEKIEFENFSSILKLANSVLDRCDNQLVDILRAKLIVSEKCGIKFPRSRRHSQENRL